MNHEPVPIDPRGALDAQVARANGMGYEPLIGGERQMVSLGRARMSSPRVLIVDEPTTSLV